METHGELLLLFFLLFSIRTGCAYLSLDFWFFFFFVFLCIIFTVSHWRSSPCHRRADIHLTLIQYVFCTQPERRETEKKRLGLSWTLPSIGMILEFQLSIWNNSAWLAVSVTQVSSNCQWTFCQNPLFFLRFCSRNSYLFWAHSFALGGQGSTDNGRILNHFSDKRPQ